MIPAVVLLSGGLDSATVLAIAKAEDFTPYALSFRYGQRHAVELDAARQIAIAQGIPQHVIVDVDLRMLGGSALVGSMSVPHHDPGINRGLCDCPPDERGNACNGTGHSQDAIPVTYVPARNTVFLSLALAWAEVLGIQDIFIGVNAVDYPGYPDCRPEYIAAYEQMANLATGAGVAGRRVRIHTPLIDLTKEQIIRRGLDLGVDYSLTWSCYDPEYAGGRHPCGTCDACRIRRAGFAAAGIEDPAGRLP